MEQVAQRRAVGDQGTVRRIAEQVAALPAEIEVTVPDRVVDVDHAAADEVQPVERRSLDLIRCRWPIGRVIQFEQDGPAPRRARGWPGREVPPDTLAQGVAPAHRDLYGAPVLYGPVHRGADGGRAANAENVLQTPALGGLGGQLQRCQEALAGQQALQPGRPADDDRDGKPGLDQSVRQPDFVKGIKGVSEGDRAAVRRKTGGGPALRVRSYAH